ncbi:caspase domain-containing protein [Streptomyces sp. NPDC127106]|uniref:caspase family protein n=1 Tax=Streptomyces sp. NPDC127106 TaxID=3345360 RepID=UPI00363263B9
MPTGLSIHVGLNKVDPAKYNGWDGQLMACENDARDMAELARAAGFQETVLLTEQGTVDNITGALRKAAKKLKDGDILLFTYSGHGSQMPDTAGDETDELDETLVFYDREFLDDELKREFHRFSPGVRIFSLLDCCHSGTATEAADAGEGNGEAVPRVMPVLRQQQVFEQNKEFYQRLQRELRQESNGAGPGTVLISACQDHQVALDGSANGAFTGALLRVWAQGSFSGGYQDFHRSIKDRLPRSQVPNFYTTGSPSTDFLAQKPFTV